MARLSRTTLLPVLGLSLLPAQEIRTPDLKGDDSEANAIFRVEDGAMEAWRQGDPLRWAAISAEDVSYLDPMLAAPVVGREAYRAYLQPLAGKVRYDASEYVRPRVARYGDLAVLTYNYHSLSRGPDGNLQRGSFWNTTEVYHRAGGQWRIVHSHWSYIRHQPPASLDLPLPGNEPEPKAEGVAGEILALETAAVARWRKGDPSGFLERTAPEATYFDAATAARLDGLPALKAEHGKHKSRNSFDTMDILRPRVQAYGEAALLTYQLVATRRHGGTLHTQAWNCSQVYARRDGAWKIVHTHWSHVRGVKRGGENISPTFRDRMTQAITFSIK